MSKSDNFAEKLKELESIVEWFDEDHVDIDESLKKFERGLELSKELKSHLEKTEVKVKKIKESFDVN